MKNIFVAVFCFIIITVCSCDVTLSSYWYKSNGDMEEYGGGSFSPKYYKQYTEAEMRAQKQSLGEKRYSITDITKINNNIYLIFGTDRNYIKTGVFRVTKQRLDEILKYETVDTNYKKIGW